MNTYQLYVDHVFFQLRQLWAVRRSLTIEAAHTLVHAFVNSRLDYCNSLLFNIGKGLLERLQGIQNAAARLVTGSRKYDHITPVLRSLHWLPIHQRIDFKIATLVYKCLHGLTPPYLADDCVLVSSLSISVYCVTDYISLFAVIYYRVSQ